MNPDFLSSVIQIGCTLAILSFLYKDNPVYKFVEHLFVGVATGWWIVLEFRNVFLPNLYEPLKAGLTGTGEIIPRWPGLFVPLILGLLLFTRFVPKVSWLSRWSMAAIVGTFAGLAITGFASGDLFSQIRSNIIPLVAPGAVDAFKADPGVLSLLGIFSNAVLIVGVIAVLFYFFFSVEHEGASGKLALVGVWFLMVSFGASYGNTVMARISLFIDRARLLIIDQTGDRPHWPISLALTLVIIAILVVWERGQRAESE